MSAWNETNTTEHRELWTANELSASEIGTKLGFSRSAVIGKAYRQGLIRKEKGKDPGNYRRPRRKHRAVDLRNKLTRLMLPKLPLPVEAFDPVESRNIRFVDLKPMHCREVTGHDGLATYCGHPKFGGTSFCAAHCAVNYNFKRAVSNGDSTKRPIPNTANQIIQNEARVEDSA